MSLRFFLLFASLVSISEESFSAERPSQPNIVLILADDLGWQDVKCYDVDEPSPFETPNIDTLARKGVLFWQAYSPAPTCAPTRCAIFSGKHPARTQKTHVVGGAPPTPYHRTKSRMIAPWYSGRMLESEITLAEALRENGYTTGHTGKWHMAIDHKAFPQPQDQGFDYSRSHLGVTRRMNPDRLNEFATTKKEDPYRLDENGFAFHQTNEDALNFLEASKAKPFFLYYASWLVHTPIHIREKSLLEKYCQKLGVEFPAEADGWDLKGQRNPYYCAMVEALDYHLGRLFSYLETTEDPRWPGHQLIENTYVILTSDNGGMERVPGEVITDNYPLDRGKISAREGGTRVPLIIAGPGIPLGVESHVMVNGLDFYPTILSLTKTPKPEMQLLDGCDLSKLLLTNPIDSSLVRTSDGRVRDTLMWHFPHSVAMQSTIRVGDYKLIKNYDPNAKNSLELFRLYQSESNKVVRIDIEESLNLADTMPARTKQLHEQLLATLDEMKASVPYLNPHYHRGLRGHETICRVINHEQRGREVYFAYEENGASVKNVDLIYTLNGGDRYEEWYRKEAQILSIGQGRAELPKGTTHFVLNLIDENQFLVSYPDLEPIARSSQKTDKYSSMAIQVQDL